MDTKDLKKGLDLLKAKIISFSSRKVLADLPSDPPTPKAGNAAIAAPGDSSLNSEKPAGKKFNIDKFVGSEPDKHGYRSHLRENYKSAMTGEHAPAYHGKKGGIHVFHTPHHDKHQNLIGHHIHDPSDSELSDILADAHSNGTKSVVIHGVMPAKGPKKKRIKPGDSLNDMKKSLSPGESFNDLNKSASSAGKPIYSPKIINPKDVKESGAGGMGIPNPKPLPKAAKPFASLEMQKAEELKKK